MYKVTNNSITTAFNNLKQVRSYAKGYWEGAQLSQQVEQTEKEIDDFCDSIEDACCYPIKNLAVRKFDKLKIKVNSFKNQFK
jgi:hypothetical protein